MYFFFKNFAFLEISFSTVCIPRFLYRILSGDNSITCNTWRSEVKFAQSCPNLWDSMDCSPPGSSVHGVLQGRILEWAAIFFFRGSSQPRDRTWVSCIADWFFTNWVTRETYLGIIPFLQLINCMALEKYITFLWLSFFICKTRIIHSNGWKVLGWQNMLMALRRSVSVWVCVCVCMWERERERENASKGNQSAW